MIKSVESIMESCNEYLNERLSFDFVFEYAYNEMSFNKTLNDLLLESENTDSKEKKKNILLRMIESVKKVIITFFNKIIGTIERVIEKIKQRKNKNKIDLNIASGKIGVSKDDDIKLEIEVIDYVWFINNTKLDFKSFYDFSESQMQDFLEDAENCKVIDLEKMNNTIIKKYKECIDEKFYKYIDFSSIDSILRSISPSNLFSEENKKELFTKTITINNGEDAIKRLAEFDNCVDKYLESSRKMITIFREQMRKIIIKLNRMQYNAKKYNDEKKCESIIENLHNIDNLLDNMFRFIVKISDIYYNLNNFIQSQQILITRKFYCSFDNNY